MLLLKVFLNSLKDTKGELPSLYLNLESNNLSRLSTLSLVIVLIKLREKVYLINVTTLSRDAFDVIGLDSCSLRSILESSKIIKVFFNIRNDSNVLFSLYNVKVRRI